MAPKNPAKKKRKPLPRNHRQKLPKEAAAAAAAAAGDKTKKSVETYICKALKQLKEMLNKLVVLSVIALTFARLGLAYESPLLQDFCVAEPNSSVKVNGITCKNMMQVQAEDFFFSGLHIRGNTSNPLGLKVTPVFVTQLPGLNALGLSMVRLDYAPWGVNPPHTHPRASEILTVLEGTVQVGFVTSNPDNRLFTKILRKGDVFVFPVGLVHYQRNVGKGHAVVIAAFNSQNPGAITIPNSVFGANPPLPGDMLARGFQVDKSLVDQLQAKF